MCGNTIDGARNDVRAIDVEEVEAAPQKSSTSYIVAEPVEPLTLSKLKTLDLRDIVYGLHCIVQCFP